MAGSLKVGRKEIELTSVGWLVVLFVRDKSGERRANPYLSAYGDRLWNVPRCRVQTSHKRPREVQLGGPCEPRAVCHGFLVASRTRSLTECGLQKTFN